MHYHLTRHRKFQLVVTLGVTTCAVLSIAAPHLGHVAVVAGTLTNIVWIWE
jgi:hypothetical protein